MVTISKRTVEQAKKHYRTSSLQQAHFQLATKSILNSSGITPFEQGFYFAFNDQIFSLTSKFGNGKDGKHTVLKTAYVFCAYYVNMLGSKFNLAICNKILALYSIPAYSPYLALEFEKAVSLFTFPVLDFEVEKAISLLTSYSRDAISITEELYTNAFDARLTAWVEVGLSPYLQNSDPDNIHCATDLFTEGDWTFPISAGSGTINSAKLRLQSLSTKLLAGTVTVYVWNGSAWVNAGYFYPTTVLAWYELDVSAILNTWAKINGVEVYLEYGKELTAICTVQRLTRKVSYTY